MRATLFAAALTLATAHDPAASQEAPDRGTALMVRQVLGVTSALQLSGATLCMQTGTATGQHIVDYFKSNNMQFNPIVFEDPKDIFFAYNGNYCDAIAVDASELHAARLKLRNPDDHVVLPERLGLR